MLAFQPVTFIKKTTVQNTSLTNTATAYKYHPLASCFPLFFEISLIYSANTTQFCRRRIRQRVPRNSHHENSNSTHHPSAMRRSGAARRRIRQGYLLARCTERRDTHPESTKTLLGKRVNARFCQPQDCWQPHPPRRKLRHIAPRERHSIQCHQTGQLSGQHRLPLPP